MMWLTIALASIMIISSLSAMMLRHKRMKQTEHDMYLYESA